MSDEQPVQTAAQAHTEGLRFAEVLASLRAIETRLEALESRMAQTEARQLSALETLVTGLLQTRE